MAKPRMTVTGLPPARRCASIAVCSALFVVAANGMMATVGKAVASGSAAPIVQRMAETPDVSAEIYWHTTSTGRFELVAETEDAVDATRESDPQVWFDLDKPTGVNDLPSPLDKPPTGVDDLRNPYPENGQPEEVGAAIYLT